MLTNVLHSALCIAALSFAWMSPAPAQTVEVETGIFCDTQQQIERFVAVFDEIGRAHV